MIWKIWVCSGIILFTLEILTPGFFMACLGVAFFAAGATAWLGYSYEVQLITVSIVGLLAAFILRPFILKLTASGKELKTGSRAFIGKTAVVSRGRIELDGQSWKAYLENGTPATEGTCVEVIHVGGASLTVKEIKCH